MKTLFRIVLLLGLTLHCSAQINIQKTSGGVISNGPITLGSGNTFTAAAGATVDFSLANVLLPGGGGGSGTVTSVNASGGTTGFGFTGGPVTGSGVLTLTVSNAATARTGLGLGNVDNTSDATKNAATATLTNKSISGSTNTLTNLPASGITGVIPIANLATGTPTGSKFIRDDGTLQAIPGGGDALTSNPLSQFAATTSAQLAGVITNETGSGLLVFGTSPTLVTPALGTPSAVVLTNGTGLPLTTGVTGVLPVANGGTGTTTPGLVQGTNVTITGTWPNQTVNSAGGSGTPMSYHATSNTTGDSTITAAQAVHTEVVTFGGTNGTRRLSLLTSGAAAGYRVTVQALFQSSGNITMELYNASTAGTLLGTFTTDGAESNGVIEFYFDGTAWNLLRSQIPAY